LSILVVSMHEEALYAERVLRAGARGYIMKGGGENLLTAIRQILSAASMSAPACPPGFLRPFGAENHEDRVPRLKNSATANLKSFN